MWTGLFLACLNGGSQCLPFVSTVFYESEQECIADFISGLALVENQFPGYEVVDGPKCIQWEHNPPNV